MLVTWEFITGFMVGFELFDDEYNGKGIIVDMFIVRIIFDWV